MVHKKFVLIINERYLLIIQDENNATHKGGFIVDHWDQTQNISYS